MLSSYGWGPALQRDFAPHAAAGLAPARVVACDRGLWRLMTEAGETTAELPGRFAFRAEAADLPAVGDYVAFRPGGSLGLIEAVLERRTAFTRRAAGRAGGPQVVAANVDLALIVASLNSDLNPRRLERYMALALASGAEPLVVATKLDLARDPALALASIAHLVQGASAMAVSAFTGESMGELERRLAPGATAVLLGSSGVGKSTLANALLGEARQMVRAIREGDERGRHTTTRRELVLLPSGALLIDTPGMREVGLIDLDEGLEGAFGDIDSLARDCRFRDCRHAGEPGCAVAAALDSGELDEGRLQGWRKLAREAAFEQAKEDPALRSERRRRWVAIAKANRRRDRGGWEEA